MALSLEQHSLEALLNKPIMFVVAQKPYGSPLERIQRLNGTRIGTAGGDSAGAVPATNGHIAVSPKAKRTAEDAFGNPSVKGKQSSPASFPAKTSAKATVNEPVGDRLPEPKQILFDSSLLSHTWNSGIALTPPGLHNLGNTCFLNAAMQALMHVPPLVQYLLSQNHRETCRMSNCILCKVEEHVARAYPKQGSTKGRAFRPALAGNLKQIGKRFRLGRQEDSHEFLILLLDAMQNSCLHGQPKTLEHRSRQTTMIHAVFGGHLRQQIVCTRCRRASNTYEALLVLSLDVTSSLQQSLARLTATDTLQGKNKYRCEHCKSLQDARKQTTVSNAPRTLIVHFKRFQYAMRSSKISKAVAYPAKLDLTPFMAPGRAVGNVTYALQAVVVHAGSGVNSGHYYAFGKSAGGQWHEFDDESVRRVTEQDALQQQAYMLVYGQIGDHSSTSTSLASKAAAINGSSESKTITERTPAAPLVGQRQSHSPANRYEAAALLKRSAQNHGKHTGLRNLGNNASSPLAKAKKRRISDSMRV
ncbi:hypothetical protein PYCC9005_003149 [Savitreella phatthalungensis]